MLLARDEEISETVGLPKQPRVSRFSLISRGTEEPSGRNVLAENVTQPVSLPVIPTYEYPYEQLHSARQLNNYSKFSGVFASRSRELNRRKSLRVHSCQIET